MSEARPIRLQTLERASTASGNGEADPGRMLSILWRGKWILLALPLVALVAARTWLARQTPLYLATAQVQVDARTVSVLKAGAGEAINKPRTVLKQQQSLLESATLLKRLAESPALAGMRTFAPERLGGRTVVGALFQGLKTSIDPEADRLFLTFLGPDREEAVAIVDEALRVYLDHHRDKKREQAGALADIVRREWESAVTELAEASRAIAALQSENGLLAGLDRTPLQTELDDANAALHAAHLRTLELESEHRELRAASADAAGFRERGAHWRAKAPVPALEDAAKARQAERSEKEAELARLERAFGPEHAGIARLRAEIAALDAADDALALDYARHYLTSTGVEHARARLYKESLAAEQQTLLARVTGQNAVIDRIRDLEIERGHLRERVAGFEERISQLELENETGALNLDVIEFARAPVKPAYPPAEKATLYALGLGAMLAFGLVLLLGLADRAVRRVEDVPALLGTSVLGVLPELPRGTDRATAARMAADDPRSFAAEAIRSARTAASFALPGGRGMLLVAASGSGEGTSVCASNLALSFARSGKRTLLVDAAFRSSAQARIHAVPAGVGLAGLLSSSVPLKTAIVQAVAKGLDLLPAGDARGHAAELFEGDVLAGLLESLRETYDCVVVDGPAVLETAEARRLAALVDGVVMVLRLDRAKAPAVERAAGILRGVGARILGVLVNGAGVRHGARDYAAGITWGDAPEGAVVPAPPSDGPEGAGDPRGRGTGFLGLGEESA